MLVLTFFPSPLLKTGSTNVEHAQAIKSLRWLDTGDLGEKPGFRGIIFHRISCIPHRGIMIQEIRNCPSNISSPREYILRLNCFLVKQMLSFLPLIPIQNNKIQLVITIITLSPFQIKLKTVKRNQFTREYLRMGQRASSS